MKVGCYQFSPIRHDLRSNRALIAETARDSNLDLIVFPELACSGYTFASREELLACSETRDGESTQLLQSISDASGTTIITGFAELDEQTGLIYNSAVCTRAGMKPLVYRKAHLFNTEKEFFSCGDTGFFTCTTHETTIGILICFDHMFPEAARTLALQGASLICHPSNLVLEGYAQLTTRVRAMENHVFWILANRVGTEGSLTFTGSSQIVDPTGNLLSQAGRDSCGLYTAEFDPDRAANKHITRSNDLFADRRTDLYRI
ncbi:MAG: hypothetical protein K9M84_05250 [Spirochaetia bacterium]|nr:hypothetical protein [Spirochaetia bacterium]MCF7940996.1 hypothetical protein [Spirochaetia bacterium]